MKQLETSDLLWLAAERVLLGTTLVCPEWLADVRELVTARDFRDPDHARLWSLLLDLGPEMEPLIALLPYVEAESKARRERLTTMLADFPLNHATRFQSWYKSQAKDIAAFAAQDRYQREVAKLQQQYLAESDAEVRATIAEAIRCVPLPAGDTTEPTTANHTDEVFAAVLDGKSASAWVCSTGLQAFDERNGGGLHPGRLYVLAGRPGWGKTALALQMIASACRQGFPSAFASLEMPETDLILRLAAYLSGVYVMDRDYARWPLSRDERQALEDAQVEIRKWPLHLRCRTTTAQQLVGWVSDLQQRAGVKVVAVDYLQIIAGAPKQSAYERIGEASRLCKQLALQGLAVVAAAQLNREAEATERPTAATLSGADQIAMDADCVLVPWRPKDNSGAPDGYAELVTVKGRRTKLGRARVQWIGKTQSFADSLDDYLMQVSDGSSTARGGSKW